MAHRSGKSDGLEIAEDRAFHRASWKAQHIAWAVLLIIVVAALLGLFGFGGPLSWTRAATADGALAVEYERFAHRGANARIKVEVDEIAAEGGLRLRVSRDYLERASVESIAPDPLRVEANGDDLVYVFAAPRGDKAIVSFQLKMQRVGRARARFALDPNRALEFTQFVYP